MEHKYLAKRGSKMLFLYTVSKCMESVLGKKITDAWMLSFKDNSNFDTIVSLWTTVIKSILPAACSQLQPVINDGLKSKESSEKAADIVVGIISSIQDVLRPQFADFIDSLSK